ncbi:hypothetical protein M5689_019094 [Euphorbia peplus]|nr:hypothetical protein M5689_019094 [Euphorbia peplus]
MFIKRFLIYSHIHGRNLYNWKERVEKMTLFRKIAKKSEHRETLKPAKKTTFKRKLKQEEDEVFETLENNAGLKMETKKEEEFEEFKSSISL